MTEVAATTCSAFEGNRRIATGSLAAVAKAAKAAVDRDPTARILIFDHAGSRPVELDLRGSMDDVLNRLDAKSPAAPVVTPSSAPGEAHRGPGRPRLGVVAREVTLLPRHWEWLNLQPGGASVALRKLVEDARRVNANGDQTRQAQESAYRFMSAMAGDFEGFESATRALFAGDADRFDEFTANWPADVRDHARMLATPALNADRLGE